MNQLWAPWRMAYILSTAETSAECIFCAFPANGPAHHREHLILWAGRHSFVIMNRYPYSNGHLLVVPRRHVADPEHLPGDEYQACTEVLRRTTTILRKVLAAHGMNIGMNLGRVAGAGIESHCHWHLVPRWNGDTNFMAVVGDTRVISEHLEATYERLLPHFAAVREEPGISTSDNEG
ncbi:MAG: HIT domain-containing protein [Pseudomonadota bacterium]